jgi:1,4-alpha-glucan branching enzyme
MKPGTEGQSVGGTVAPPSGITEYDVHLLLEGKHARLYEKLGSGPARVDGVDGASFALWAPNARSVSVIGDFNGSGRGSSPGSAKAPCTSTA